MVSWQRNAVEVEDCDLSAETIGTDRVGDNGIDCRNPAVGTGPQHTGATMKIEASLSFTKHGISTVEYFFWGYQQFYI